jgi:pimeloyl-ACP methyl ester carboxylesterase
MICLGLILALGCAPPVKVSTFDSSGRPDLTPYYEHRTKDLKQQLDLEPLQAMIQARRVEGLLPNTAAGLYLKAARLSYPKLTDEELDHATRSLWMTEVYNRAVAGFLRNVSNSSIDRWVRISPDANQHTLSAWETVTPAADLRIEGISKHYVQVGLVAAVVLQRETDPDDPADSLFPPEGVFRPATAVLRFDKASSESNATEQQSGNLPELAIYSPYATDTAKVKEKEFAISRDLTAPYAMLLSNTKDLAGLGFAALLEPGRENGRLGIYLLEPYDPSKTPVLLVHGLMSTPLMWVELTNEIQNNRRIEDHFQVWHYLYPTGECPYYSAHFLREHIASVQEKLDPEGDDPASQDMVVVGHSMGGIVTKALVTEPEKVAWEMAFSVPPHELEGEAETIAFMEDVYLHQPIEKINRVVFICTPHRGADLATNWIGKLGRALVELPEFCVDLTIELARLNRPHLIEPYGVSLLDGPPNSIEILSPESTSSQLADVIEFKPGLQYHSIIGTRELVDDPLGTSDGIVDYWSSHLDGAASELTVPAGHNAHEHPAAVREVLRILRLHLDEREASLIADRQR